MKSYLYNQFIVIGSSVCRQKNCTNDHIDPHFSSLIFFSYPNSTDEDFDVSEYLFNNNNITIEALEIDLKKYIKIENNIFGYIFYGIKILSQCFHINLFILERINFIMILKHKKKTLEGKCLNFLF